MEWLQQVPGGLRAFIGLLEISESCVNVRSGAGQLGDELDGLRRFDVLDLPTIPVATSSISWAPLTVISPWFSDLPT